MGNWKTIFSPFRCSVFAGPDRCVARAARERVRGGGGRARRAGIHRGGGQGQVRPAQEAVHQSGRQDQQVQVRERLINNVFIDFIMCFCCYHSDNVDMTREMMSSRRALLLRLRCSAASSVSRNFGVMLLEASDGTRCGAVTADHKGRTLKVTVGNADTNEQVTCLCLPKHITLHNSNKYSNLALLH